MTYSVYDIIWYNWRLLNLLGIKIWVKKKQKKICVKNMIFMY